MKLSGPSKHLGYLLKEVQHSIRTRMDNALREIDLTTPQYAIISELDEYPGLSNADLARKSFVTPQTMNLIVRSLEDRGLISKEIDRNQKRRLNFKLSQAGVQKLRKAHALVNEIESTLFECLSLEERKALEDILIKISDQSSTTAGKSGGLSQKRRRHNKSLKPTP